MAYALVDDEDFERVNEHRWWLSRTRNKDYAATRIDGRFTRLHSFLTGWRLVDHKNGDGLDDQRGNLRPATGSQNNANAKKRKGKSRFRGVYKHLNGKWLAAISDHGKNRHIGLFRSEEQAARAYDREARILHGPFARLNLPCTAECTESVATCTEFC